MTYHQFLAYLFDRAETRELAMALAVAVVEHREHQIGGSARSTS